MNNKKKSKENDGLWTPSDYEDLGEYSPKRKSQFYLGDVLKNAPEIVFMIVVVVVTFFVVWLIGRACTNNSKKSKLDTNTIQNATTLKTYEDDFGAIYSIKVEHNVFDGDTKGFYVNFSYDVSNMKNEKLLLSIYFTDEYGNNIKANDDTYRNNEGDMRIRKEVFVDSQKSNANRFNFFVPYNALPKNSNDIDRFKFYITLSHWKNDIFSYFEKSSKYNFSITHNSCETNTYQNAINPEVDFNYTESDETKNLVKQSDDRTLFNLIKGSYLSTSGNTSQYLESGEILYNGGANGNWSVYNQQMYIQGQPYEILRIDNKVLILLGDKKYIMKRQ